VPFPITLERDSETGLDRYVVVAPKGFGIADAHELSDWLGAAAQNPTAAFAVDLSALGADSRAAEIVVAATEWLRSERRLELVPPAPAVSAA
jgi:hypothetical protein